MDKAPHPPFTASQPKGEPPEGHWCEAAHNLWRHNRHQEALERLQQEIDGFPPNQPPRQQSLQRVLYLFNLGEYAPCERWLRQLVRCYPKEIIFIENLVVLLMKQGKVEGAKPWIQVLEQQQQVNFNQLDLISAFYQKTGNIKKARIYGEISLAGKSRVAKPLPNWWPPQMSPGEWLKERHGQNVLAFSLWGTRERYLYGAQQNMNLIPQLYPGWTMRLYCDSTVPPALLQEARQKGVQVMMMPHGQSMGEKLCWRFLVANDPKVGRFQVRDIDAVVSGREQRAVAAWIHSGRWFHVMRDWWSHTDPMLAGMWGGIAGILPQLQPLLRAYEPGQKDTPNVDQQFLRHVLWGSIRHHALIHDRCFRSEGAIPWPDPDPPSPLHVGRNQFAGRESSQ